MAAQNYRNVTQFFSITGFTQRSGFKQVFHLDDTFTGDQLRHAYQAAMLNYHPDRNFGLNQERTYTKIARFFNRKYLQGQQFLNGEEQVSDEEEDVDSETEADNAVNQLVALAAHHLVEIMDLTGDDGVAPAVVVGTMGPAPRIVIDLTGDHDVIDLTGDHDVIDLTGDDEDIDHTDTE